MDQFTFTRDQLDSLLRATIEMFIEYRDIHGSTEKEAQWQATNETIEGLDAERDLVKTGELKATTMQVN